MNLGARIAGALAALSGSTALGLAANSEADATFRGQTEATLTALGAITTDLKTQVAALADKVAAGETVDPTEFANLKATIDSLDAAFPDAETAPPEADEPEEPIEVASFAGGPEFADDGTGDPEEAPV